MFKLGLTGSIGMGKSTTSDLFLQMGCAVWNADAAVHRLYEENGKAVGKIAETFPQAIENNSVSRETLRDLVAQNHEKLRELEAIVHPLLAQDRLDFIEDANCEIGVFDIPLLFETGSDAQMDATVCVWVDGRSQERRVMDRNTMTRAQFLAINEKQMPINEKKARADFLIETDTLDHAESQVRMVIDEIHQRMKNA